MVRRSTAVGVVFLLAALLVVRSISAGAAKPVSIRFNGETVEFEVPPIIQDNRTFVPVRFVLDRIGAEINWDGEKRQVTIFFGDRVVILTLDSKIVVVDGVEIEIDVAPFIMSSRTMVPLRFVAETFGFGVGFDEETQTVSLVPPPAAAGTVSVAPPATPATPVPTPPPAPPMLGPAIEVSAPSSAKVGDTFTVRVNFVGVHDVKSAGLILSFNNTQVQAVKVTSGGILEGLSIARTADNTKGTVTYETALIGGTFSGDGMYFQVDFKALTAGIVHFSVTSADSLGPLWSPDLRYMSATMVSGDTTLTN